MHTHRNGGRLGFKNRRQPTELVEDHPFSSMLLMFSIGVGVGLVVGHAICESWTRDFEHESTRAERLAKQFRQLWQSAMPEAVSKHFGA